jgi:hypothetical protein
MLHATDLGLFVLIILAIHIAAGAASVCAGLGAIFLEKGGRGHRACGKIFTVAMVIMAGCAAYIAFRIGSVTVGGALLTIYLVASSWSTIRRAPMELTFYDWIGTVFVALIAATNLWFGEKALLSPTGVINGFPAPPFLVSGLIALVATIGDVRVMIRRGIDGRARIARHLWRMCVALFIAFGSLMTQGLRHVLPDSVRGTPLHWALILVPGLSVLIVMIFWLIRVRFTGWYRVPDETPET